MPFRRAGVGPDNLKTRAAIGGVTNQPDPARGNRRDPPATDVTRRVDDPRLSYASSTQPPTGFEPALCRSRFAVNLRCVERCDLKAKLVRAVGFEPTWSMKLVGFGDQCFRPLSQARVMVSTFGGIRTHGPWPMLQGRFGTARSGHEQRERAFTPSHPVGLRHPV